jgi:hypothetical protein
MEIEQIELILTKLIIFYSDRTGRRDVVRSDPRALHPDEPRHRADDREIPGRRLRTLSKSLLRKSAHAPYRVVGRSRR